MLTLIVIIVIAGFILERVLDYLNTRNWSTELPEKLKHVYDEEKYRKAQLYYKSNKQLSLVNDSLTTGVLLLLLHCGTFGKLDDWALEYTRTPLQATLLFFGVIGGVSELINLPFSVYRTFVIESHFGFNKTTPGLFIKDKIKGYIIAFILLGGLLSIFSFLYREAGSAFWFYTWIIVSVVMMLMSKFYTTVLLPVFNKLKPLPEGELRSSIINYCKRTGFGLSDVMIMDGSKRSTKANAFFSGLGRTRKIVLFDTLVDSHSTGELVSVLAHETGHYKKKHTTLGLIVSVLQLGLMLFLFSIFMESNSVHEAFGGNHHTIELGLLAFGMLYSPVSMLTGLLVNYISRRNEFQADAYAAKTSDGKALKEALIKLSVNNLSNLNPHPAYVFFYYSHPPLLQRLNALDRVIQTGKH